MLTSAIHKCGAEALMLVLSESRLALRRFLVTSSQVVICVEQTKIVKSLKCFSSEKLKLLRASMCGG